MSAFDIVHLPINIIVIDKVISIIRKEGFLAFFRKLLCYVRSNLGYSLEAYFIFKKTLESRIVNNELEYPVTILSQPCTEDIERLIECWPEYFRHNRSFEKLKKDLQSHFVDGDLCYLLIEKDRVIAMSWVGFEKNYMMSGMAAKIPLGKTGAIVQRSYVDEEYRGQGLQVKLRKYIYKHLYEELGVREVYIYVGVKNFASIKNNSKITDTRHLIYHLQINLLGYRINLFPKYSIEGWEYC